MLPTDEVIMPVDLSEAAEVYAILEQHYRNPREPMGGSWSLQSIETELRIGAGRALYRRGQIQGFVLFRRGETETEITVLATRTGQERQGVMVRILEDFLAMEDLAGREVWLEVQEKNLGAQKLYEKLGFKKVNERPRYYRDEGAAWLYTR